MSTSASTIPLSPNIGSQIGQLKNVFRVLAKPGDQRQAQALKLRKRISESWEEQTAQDKYFQGPTTAAPFGAGDLRNVFWRPKGMLDFLGYHVGVVQPTSRSERHCILEYVFECYLPPLNDPGYLSEWGRPQTARRLEKLADSLAAFTRNARRRNNRSFDAAIDDWEDDLAFLYDRYYVSFARFWWPTTGVSLN